MDEDFWSWLAGFWEGEGSLVIGKRHNLLSIPQTNVKPLEYIGSQLGFGKIYPRYNNKNPNPNWSPCWNFHIGRVKEILEVVEGILPHVRFRSEELKEKREKLLQKVKVTRSKRLRWTKQEDQILIGLYPQHSTSEIAKVLNRTSGSIGMRAFSLKITPKKGSEEWRLRCGFQGRT